MDEYEFHESANLFPMLPEDKIKELADDIARYGVKESGTLYQGKILDGRNRYTACRIANVEMWWEELEEEDGFDPVAFVLSKNLHRRHLSTSQRAAIAAEVARLNRGANQHTEDVQICTPSMDEAAKALGVSRRSVATAKHVADHGDQSVVDAVKAGEIKVSAAAALVDAEPDKAKQREIVAGGKEAVAAATRKPAKPQDPPPCAVCGVFVPVDGDDRCQRCIDTGRTVEDADEANVQAPAMPKGRGKGIERAHEAINSLRQISPRDPLRDRGLQIVADFIKTNAKISATRKPKPDLLGMRPAIQEAIVAEKERLSQLDPEGDAQQFAEILGTADRLSDALLSLTTILSQSLAAEGLGRTPEESLKAALKPDASEVFRLALVAFCRSKLGSTDGLTTILVSAVLENVAADAMTW